MNWLKFRWICVAPVLAILALSIACSGQSEKASPATAPGKVFYISGIPDQETAYLARRFGSVADYLTNRLGVQVKYQPSVDYAAVVAGFKRGDIHMGWYGGLTGVQARLAVPDSEAIAQRGRDAAFHSVFIVQAGLDVKELKDLKSLTLTFGSESSTSGHLMPRYFLVQAGIDPDKDLNGKPNFSGSHDTTWKLVESGAYQAGALNEDVWERAVRDSAVNLSKVRVFYKTPPYFDYHWVIRGDVDKTFEAGFKEKVKEALMSLGPRQKKVLDLFSTDRFIETSNENYKALEQVARQLGIVQ